MIPAAAVYHHSYQLSKEDLKQAFLEQIYMLTAQPVNTEQLEAYYLQCGQYLNFIDTMAQFGFNSFIKIIREWPELNFLDVSFDHKCVWLYNAKIPNDIRRFRVSDKIEMTGVKIEIQDTLFLEPHMRHHEGRIAFVQILNQCYIDGRQDNDGWISIETFQIYLIQYQSEILQTNLEFRRAWKKLFPEVGNLQRVWDGITFNEIEILKINEENLKALKLKKDPKLLIAEIEKDRANSIEFWRKFNANFATLEEQRKRDQERNWNPRPWKKYQSALISVKDDNQGSEEIPLPPMQNQPQQQQPPMIKEKPKPINYNRPPPVSGTDSEEDNRVENNAFQIVKKKTKKIVLDVDENADKVVGVVVPEAAHHATSSSGDKKVASEIEKLQIQIDNAHENVAKQESSSTLEFNKPKENFSMVDEEGVANQRPSKFDKPEEKPLLNAVFNKADTNKESPNEQQHPPISEKIFDFDFTIKTQNDDAKLVKSEATTAAQNAYPLPAIINSKDFVDKVEEVLTEKVNPTKDDEAQIDGSFSNISETRDAADKASGKEETKKDINISTMFLQGCRERCQDFMLIGDTLEDLEYEPLPRKIKKEESIEKEYEIIEKVDGTPPPAPQTIVNENIVESQTIAEPIIPSENDISKEKDNQESSNNKLSSSKIDPFEIFFDLKKPNDNQTSSSSATSNIAKSNDSKPALTTTFNSFAAPEFTKPKEEAFIKLPAKSTFEAEEESNKKLTTETFESFFLNDTPKSVAAVISISSSPTVSSAEENGNGDYQDFEEINADDFSPIYSTQVTQEFTHQHESIIPQENVNNHSNDNHQPLIEKYCDIFGLYSKPENKVKETEKEKQSEDLFPLDLNVVDLTLSVPLDLDGLNI